MRVALDSEGLLVYASSNLNLGQDYFCPKCQKKVNLRVGVRVRPHFSHAIDKDSLVNDNPGEQKEHLFLKKILQRWFSQDQKVKVEIEKYLPQISQRPDLLINGNLALEVQCSMIPVKQLIKRCQAFKKLGMQVIWLCGQKLHLGRKLLEINRALMYHSDNIGFYYWEADASKKCLRLRFNIEETITHGVYYDELSLPLNEKNLINFFHLPKILPRVQARSYEEDSISKAYRRDLAQKIYFKNHRLMFLQGKFYREGRNLLSLPEYYYHPVIRNIACIESMISWKRKLYWLLSKNLPITNFTEIKQRLKMYPTPLISTSVHLKKFVNSELSYLKKKGFV